MSYIGISPSTAAFPYDQFSGNGSTTAFTMSYTPASTTSIIVSISGVVQNPNTYSVTGLTLNFSPAPPTGTNNIGVLYLGIPATSVTTPGNTAYLTTTSFTATAGQTTFTPSSTYQVGFINVIRNGSQLAPADFTATNGTTVVLANPCVAGDTVVTQGYTLASLVNALPLTGGTVTGATTFSGTTAFSGTNTFSGASTFTNQVTINGGSASGYTGFKNRIINGEMDIDQRNNGASQTITNGAANVYCLDRWIAFSSGSNITTQQVASGVTGIPYVLQITGAAGNTAAQCSQKIESRNIADLAGSTVTLSALLSNSVNTSMYWFAFYANTTDNFSAITQIATGTFTVNSTLTQYSVQIALPALAANGVQIVLGSSTQTSGTLRVGNVQLERGSNATSFEFRDYGRELIMCQRYFQICNLFNYGTNAYYQGYYGGSNAVWNIRYPVQMRATPTATISQPTQVQYYSQGNVWTNTTISLGSYNNGSPNYNAGTTDLTVQITSDSTGGGKLLYLVGGATTTLPTISISAEL